MANFTVTTNADSGPGSLRQAVNDANSSGEACTIEFDSDYTITVISGQIIISCNLTINSLRKDITVNGNNASRVFTISSGVTVTINELSITGGFAGGGNGGAIDNWGTLNITNSTLSNNSATHGGAISNSGTIKITNSTLSSNIASGCGGAIVNTGTINIINSTLSSNIALGTTGWNNGAAIWNIGPINISFSTIAENQATPGAGIYGSNYNFKNSIVANNSNSNFDAVGTNSVSGINFSTDNTCKGFKQITADELRLAPLALNSPGTTETHALLRGSRAINTVTDYTDLDGNVVTTDQRGVSRPQQNAGDAGSYELIIHPATKNRCSRCNKKAIKRWQYNVFYLE